MGVGRCDGVLDPLEGQRAQLPADGRRSCHLVCLECHEGGVSLWGCCSSAYDQPGTAAVGWEKQLMGLGGWSTHVEAGEAIAVAVELLVVVGGELFYR